MTFSKIMTDNMFIEDETGKRSGPYKTKFGGKKITVFQNDLCVSEGNRIIQPLPNGSEQIYIAEDVTFSSGLGKIMPHYAIIIEKADKSHKKATSMSNNVFNIQGSNVQVGNNNIQHIVSSMQSLVKDIDDSNFPPEEKQIAKGAMRTLFENPVVASVLGGAVQGILGMFKS